MNGEYEKFAGNLNRIGRELPSKELIEASVMSRISVCGHEKDVQKNGRCAVISMIAAAVLTFVLMLPVAFSGDGIQKKQSECDAAPMTADFSDMAAHADLSDRDVAAQKVTDGPSISHRRLPRQYEGYLASLQRKAAAEKLLPGNSCISPD